MRQNPHVRICGGPGSATTLVYPTDRSGGAHGERTRLKNQMRRLFSCSVSLIYADEQREDQVHSFVADRVKYWWDVSRPDAPVLWDSTIQLGGACQ